MSKPINSIAWLAIALSALLLTSIAAILLSKPNDINCLDTQSLNQQRFQLDAGMQTSGSYLYKVAKWNACSAPNNPNHQLRYQLVSDIYIKARSYALINKISFWIALTFILMIFGIPIAYAAKETAEGSEAQSQKHLLKAVLWKVLSPTQIPAITLVAGLSFTLYENYKEKQSQAESLMRYVLLTDQPTSVLSKTVIDTLAVIDTGFSFTSFLSGTREAAPTKE